MSPASDRWNRLRDAFERLADLEPQDREEALQGLQDTDLASELRSLLAGHDADTGGRLSEGALAHAALPPPMPDAPRVEDRRGQRLGAWRVVGSLGSGGMGDVWLAQRDDGHFRAEAAIKVLRRGLDTAVVLARFAQEQQTLAQLTHPGIARLLDAGRTEDGLPYFVMERVEGEPIHRAGAKLPLEERLGLFLQLTDAVAHAHSQRLVHRDLKPSNVLVTPQHRVKLLDFGVAKAIDPMEGNAGLTTMGAARPFTPQYASPEQVRGDTVGPASDVYSLGVVLYEMLTGVRPTGRGALTAREAALSVLEEEPRAPSQLAPGEVAEAAWSSLQPRIRGDLDNIVLKALRKPVSERYTSVEALAEDLRAFLDRRPVRARPATLPYLLLRRVQRNRHEWAAGVLGLFGLSVGVVASIAHERVAMALGAIGMALGLLLALAQSRRAAKARDEAQARFEQLHHLARQVLFEYHDLVEPLVGATPVRRRLVQDAITYLESLAQADPRDRKLRLEIATAWRAVAKVQFNGFMRPHLGDRAGALRSLDRAEAGLQALVTEDPRDDQAALELGLMLTARAAIAGEDGHWVKARQLLGRAAELHAQHCEPDRPDQRHRLEFARAQLRLTRGAISLGELAAANTHLATARVQLDRMAARQPDHPELDHVWVWVHALEKRLLRLQQRWADIPAVCDAAQVRLNRLHAAHPENARFLEDLAGLSVWRVRAAGELADLEGARRWGEDGCQRWQALSSRDPSNALARRMHLDAVIAQGRALIQAGDARSGLARLRDFEPAMDALLEATPDDVTAQARRTYLSDALSQGHEAQADLQAAQAASERAKDQVNTLLRLHPEHPAALTASLVVRLTVAQRQFRSTSDQPESAEHREARAELRRIVEDTAALHRQGQLEDHHYAWRLEEAATRLNRPKPPLHR